MSGSLASLMMGQEQQPVMPGAPIPLASMAASPFQGNQTGLMAMLGGGAPPPPVPLMAPDDPNHLTMADAYTSTKNTVGDWIAAQRADAAARGLWNPETGLPTQAGLANAMQQYGGALAAGTSAPEGVGIRAYHGSPHDFDAFDASKIGTGEGTRAFGHGFYFAGNPEVAAPYRTSTGLGPSGKVGHGYEVNINANPEHFLDWDRPLSEQSQHVQDTFQRMGYNAGQNDPTGAQLHAAFGNQAATAQFFQNAAIPGVRYLDQGSRSAGQGSHNYVVFNPQTIEILRKYGLAGLISGTGIAAASGSKSQ